MPEELLREIRKLEARVDQLMRKEEGFVEEMKRFTHLFRELNESLEALKKESDPKRVQELMSLRFEAVKAFSEMMGKKSEAEREKSRLSESYGSLFFPWKRSSENFKIDCESW